jgi:hypothetical protein
MIREFSNESSWKTWNKLQKTHFFWASQRQRKNSIFWINQENHLRDQPHMIISQRSMNITSFLNIRLFYHRLHFSVRSRLDHQIKLKIQQINRKILIHPDLNRSSEKANPDKKILTLVKLWIEDAKYNDENDSFSFKLIIFHDICCRVDGFPETKLIVFFSMLKELVLKYHCLNMSINIMIHVTFNEVCFQMKAYFENLEYKKSILFKWNNLILRTVMQSRPIKFVKECLQLLIKHLRHLQHELDLKLRFEEFILNKLINVSQNVNACQYACFKLANLLSISLIIFDSQ